MAKRQGLGAACGNGFVRSYSAEIMELIGNESDRAAV